MEKIINSSKNAELYGFDIFSASETSHNPYLPLVLAAEHTDKIELQTSIALAFSRSPMDTAYLAWDLQNISEGRFTLGLGSQVKGHIKRRFSIYKRSSLFIFNSYKKKKFFKKKSRF